MSTIIKRSAQLSARNNDPFSPLRVDSSTAFDKSTISYFTKTLSVPISDKILDGVPVVSKSSSENWAEENKLHSARSISKSIDSTRGFLGRQVIAIRDDVNLLTYAAFIESGGLIKVSLRDGELISREIVHSGYTQRVHLALNKFNGKLFVLHASKIANKTALFLNGDLIPTSSDNVDFPYMVFAQVSIGHVQTTEPEYAIISYKCRNTNKLFYRIMTDEKVSQEIELKSPNCLGGVDFEINGNDVIFRIDTIEDDVLVPMISRSNDRGSNVTTFSAIDLSDYKPDAVLPEGSGIVKDYLGNFHVPVTVMKDNSRYLLNVLSDDTIVEAIELSVKGFGTTLARFPKNPNLTASVLGRGDGVTDGTGIIAVGLSEGKLFSSNSQSGGINFPPARLLNHEMQKVFTFKPTDNCYTRSVIPNTVSMDYFYLEADDTGNTVSQELFLESWDMPLPVPVIQATTNANTIEVEIIKDGWFENGKTIFSLNNPSISITNVVIVNDRKAEISCSSSNLSGFSITYELKSLFYWQKAQTSVK